MAGGAVYQARLRAKRQLTLPEEVRELLRLSEGDNLVFSVKENGQVLVESLQTIPPDQAWFWTDRWQRLEREAQADIDSGRVHRYASVDDAIADLEDLTNAENRDCGEV